MPKAIIIGAGIGGLAAGIALKRAAWDVRVFERAPQIAPVGAALSLWPNACAALANLDVLQSITEAAAPIRSMLLADRCGKPIIERDIHGPALLVTRAALQAALIKGLGDGCLKLGCAVDSIGPDKTVLFSDGSTAAGDLIIDSGGIRAPSLNASTPRYAGYAGVLALTETIEGPGLDGVAAEYWGKSERFGVFGLPQGRRYWFYMRSQPSEASTPSLAHCHDRAAGWPASIRQAISGTNDACLIPFAVHAHPAPRHLGEDNGVRVGNAAHAMEPNFGQGACQALEDAAALLAIARVSPPHKIGTAYQRLRLKRARMIVKESARAGLGIHGAVLVQQVVRTLLRSVPRSVSERAIRQMQTMPDYAEVLANR